MSSQETAADILNGLSPEGKKLAERVYRLEAEHLHIKNPSLLKDKIVEAVKELAK